MSCRWERSWWSWIVSRGHARCVITQRWALSSFSFSSFLSFLFLFYFSNALNNNKIILFRDGMRVDTETRLQSLEKQTYTWIATSDGRCESATTRNKTRNGEFEMPLPSHEPRKKIITPKVQSSVSVLGLNARAHVRVRRCCCCCLHSLLLLLRAPVEQATRSSKCFLFF